MARRKTGKGPSERAGTGIGPSGLGRTTIDREKLRAAIRRQPEEYRFYILDAALELLTPTQLESLAKRYFDLKTLQPDEGPASQDLLARVSSPTSFRRFASLRTEVSAFERASLAGEYYEDFFVDSRTFALQSTGTSSWIADFLRLLDRCVDEAPKSEPGEACRVFDVLFGLLDEIDRCEKEIIFFADEGGSWAVGVDWDRVLEAYFRALSKTAQPEAYAARVAGLVQRHCRHDAARLLSVAGELATPEQRGALERSRPT